MLYTEYSGNLSYFVSACNAQQLCMLVFSRIQYVTKSSFPFFLESVSLVYQNSKLIITNCSEKTSVVKTVAGNQDW